MNKYIGYSYKLSNNCPLCGQNNQCAVELERETGIKQAPCWCVAVKFDADLLARVPVEKRNLACICASCAKASQAAASKPTR